MSTETTNKKIKIDNGTTFGRTYTDKAVDERLQGLVSTATFTSVKEKANNSLQKPAGLTKTKLVGVGSNGQENIEIGDNLTLANGKLSATGGGGSIQVIDGIFEQGNANGINFILNTTPSGDYFLAHISYVNTFINSLMTKYVVSFGSQSYNLYIGLRNINCRPYIAYTGLDNDGNTINKCEPLLNFGYLHFITMKKDENVALYLTIQNNSEIEFITDTLTSYLADKKVLANGNLHGVVPTYIAGEGGVIKIYYRTPGDNNINPTPDEYQDLSSFTITDLVSPVD